MNALSLLLAVPLNGPWALLALPQEESKATGLLPLIDYSGEVASRPYFSGDWGGGREQLARKGWRFEASFTQNLFGVVEGGRDEGWRYGGKLDLFVNADLDRMGVVPGGLVSMHTESRYGNSVNGIAGSILPVDDTLYFPLTDEPDADLGLAITELRYTQFFSKHSAMFLGKFTVLGGDVNEFAGGHGYEQFVSHAFSNPSVAALINPYSTLGTGLLVLPNSSWTITSALYCSTDSSTTTGFDTLDEGLTWSTTVRGQYRLGDKPGGMSLTGQYGFDNDFVDFSGQFVHQGGLSLPLTHDTWNAYWNGWQYLHVEEDSDKPIDLSDGRLDRQGLGAFARLGIADDDTNPVDFMASAGFGGRGPFSGRDEDSWGIGYAFANVKEQAFLTGTLLDDGGNRIEAYYSFAVTPAVFLTLDAQQVDSILAGVDAATILGVRLRARF
ncbi:MAG: carbohydrate porin [Planctomycetes bacterium]|nr:carbohydrate porin [Planctomycetota bacterium]